MQNFPRPVSQNATEILICKLLTKEHIYCNYGCKLCINPLSFIHDGIIFGRTVTRNRQLYDSEAT